MKNKIVVGLDIGTTKICAIVGRYNEYGKIELLGMGKVPSNGGVTRGVVTNIDRTVLAIEKAVEKAEEKSNTKIYNLHVGIAGAHIGSAQHRGMIIRKDADKEIREDDLARLEDDSYNLAVPAGHEILHVIPQEYIVDDEPSIVDPIGMSGTKLECNYHIVTGQIHAARNIYKCVEKSGYNVADLTLEPLASAEAVLSKEELEAGVVLVDIGGGTTDVAVFHDGIIRHTAVIPYGGNIITEDIKEGCNILKEYAELLKVKHGSAYHKSVQNNIITIPGLRGRPHKEISSINLSKIIQARLEEILELVAYEIKSSNLEKNLVGGIVLTGGGSQMKHIVQLASYVTGMDARIGYPIEHLAKGKVEEAKSPVYATGVGLVMRGLQGNAEGGVKEYESVGNQGQSAKGLINVPIFKRLKNWLQDDEFEDFED